MNEVRFLPWIGENYNTGGIFPKRILALGESHYCRDKTCDRATCENTSDCRDFTEKIIKKFLDPNDYDKWMNTYTKFERSLLGGYTDKKAKKRIWDSISFYNYLQYSLEGPREKNVPSDAYQKAITPYYQVLDYLEPEIIIVWGKQLWKQLPRDDRWISSDTIKTNGISIENGYYKLSNGYKARVFPVNHPSSRFSWAKVWHKVITTMIEL